MFLVEFYNQDINILKKIDSNLTIATKYREIDWSADVILFGGGHMLFPSIYLKTVEEKTCNHRNF